MKKECNFKYGEILEFTNNESFEGSYPSLGKFLAYHPDDEDGACYVDFDGDFWKYARRPLLNLKEGDPIVILDSTDYI